MSRIVRVEAINGDTIGVNSDLVALIVPAKDSETKHTLLGACILRLTNGAALHVRGAVGEVLQRFELQRAGSHINLVTT